jgi:hypothetical protein
VPVLGDPVIQAEPGLEVRTETAASSGRDTAVAQQRAAQYDEAAAGADQPPLGLARDVQRRGVQRQHGLDDRAGRPDLLSGEPAGVQAKVRRLERMQHQAGDEPADADGISRDGLEHGRADLADVRQPARSGVVDRTGHAPDPKGRH